MRGPLKISPAGQTAFLARLAKGTLALSNHGQATVRDMIRLETGNGKTLYAKTGWTTASNPGTGWFVGWIESDGGIFSFALVMEMNDRSKAPLRRKLTMEILAELGVY